MGRDHIRERTYLAHDACGGFPQLLVGETRAGDPAVRLRLAAPHLDLDAERCEQLGIDLQIRASYLRGVRPPTGPEPDPVEPGPHDVPLISADDTPRSSP